MMMKSSEKIQNTNTESPEPTSSQGSPLPVPRWLAVLLVLAALMYGVSPVDLIPEALLGPLALGDDAVVIAGALWTLYRAFFAHSTH